jgi:hypothetical protein
MSNYQQGLYQPKNGEKYVGKHTPKYRSGWELHFMRMCDNHPGIIAWSSESHRIPYIHPITGQKKTYVPDFFVVYVDAKGKRHAEIVEVKPSSQIVGEAKGQYDQAQAVINQAKWKYAKQWCEQQGIGFRIITEKDIFNNPQKPTARRGKRKAPVTRKKR